MNILIYEKSINYEELSIKENSSCKLIIKLVMLIIDVVAGARCGCSQGDA